MVCSKWKGLIKSISVQILTAVSDWFLWWVTRPAYCTVEHGPSVKCVCFFTRLQENYILLQHYKILHYEIVTACWLGYLSSSHGIFCRLKLLLHGQLILNIRRYDHITSVLISLHWLRVPERISFKIAVLTYLSLNRSAPSCLSSYFTRVIDMPSRHGLRSASSNRLTVPFCCCTTFGKRSFPVAGANIWNELPVDITSAPSLPVFRQHLKTFLFWHYWFCFFSHFLYATSGIVHVFVVLAVSSLLRPR